jgi:hypothetical protein
MKRKTDDRRCWWKFFSPHVSLKLSEGHPEKFQGSTTTGFLREAQKKRFLSVDIIGCGFSFLGWRQVQVVISHFIKFRT